MTQYPWPLLTASEKTHYGTNVCGKGWLLTLTVGMMRKKGVKSLLLLCLKNMQVFSPNGEISAKAT